jgi:transcriptional regulator GlxA family with amidase domain
LNVPFRSDLASKLAYTCEEVAEMMGFSRQTITRMFENEPGVIVIKSPTRMNKRRYRSIRIPHAVYERVLQRLSVK